MEALISEHIEVAGSGQSEENGLLLTGLLALKSLVDGNSDGMGTLRCGKSALRW